MSDLLRRRESLLLIVALLLAAAGFVFAYLAAPTRLIVAVGPEGSADERLLTAFARQLGQQKTSIRLQVMSVPDVRDAAAALERGAADLAVVRPDVAVPQNGLTMAVLRDAAVLIVSPTNAKLSRMESLNGKKLGVVLSHEADPALLTTLLRHYDLEPPAVTLVPMLVGRMVGALKERKIDAVAVVAPPSGNTASDLVRALAGAYDGRIQVMTISEADAIAQRNAPLGVITVPAGIWSGRPKQPAEDVKTVSVTYRLMARADVDRSVISVVTQHLFQMRSRLASITRAANLMKAPENDTSTSATLPNHPGAVDYFQREQESVMDRYGDWIYLLAFFGSGLASALAWLWQGLLRRRREKIDDVLDRLLIILADARAADTHFRLDELSVEIDGLLAEAVTHARTGATDSRATSALVLALDGVRGAIDDRRREIDRSGTVPPTRDGGIGREPPRLATVA